jgi:cytochrome c-type biogenesis protein CcmH/NrfG
MKSRPLRLGACAFVAFGVAVASAQPTGKEDAETVTARRARDRASVEELQKIVAKARREAGEKKSAAAYVRQARFDVWLCEAIESHEENSPLFKQTAEDGVSAAEQAVRLDPRSSEAHQLLGDLLSQLIPHVFGGGMRYGKRSTDELDKAIELDPRNADAYVSRAISYYYSPPSFGGDKQKAFEFLRRAVEIDPRADTPHVWLAMLDFDTGKQDEALSEIKLARAANPGRSFTNYVYGMITGATTESGNKPANKPPDAKKPDTKPGQDEQTPEPPDAQTSAATVSEARR